MLGLPHHESAHRPMVAFTARFYFRDNRKSHFQVYVCDLSGGRRQQLTTGSKDCSGVQWVDSNHVCFFRGTHLEVLDIASRKLSYRLPDGGLEPTERILSRGPGFYPIYSDETTSFELHSRGLKRVDHRDLMKRHVQLPLQTPWGRVDRDKNGGISLATRNGLKSIWPIEDSAVPDWPTRIWCYAHRVWVIYYNGFSSGGHISLTTWDPSGTKTVLVGACVDCDVTKKYFAWADARNAKPFGHIHVWMAEAGVLNWRTGKQAMVATGAVWVDSIALSPAAP